MTNALWAEGLGTGLLLYIIVGSGIAAENLGSHPAGQLLAHAIAVGLGLAVLIALFQTVSGSHFNPSVTLAFWRDGAIRPGTARRYVASQLHGAIAGVITANFTFGRPMISISNTTRSGLGLAAASVGRQLYVEQKADKIG